MYTHQENTLTAGVPANEAKKAIIFVHGRGGSAEDILSLNVHLKTSNAALFAPQASNNSWYPYSFIAPVEENQPALDSALGIIAKLVTDIKNTGIRQDEIYFLGFSQGACLVLEYLGRNGGKYGGAVALTGGLIGKEILRSNYQGDFKKTPILITTGDPDPHVPVSRVELTKEIFEQMGAAVTLEIYPGRPHTISKSEILLAKELIFK